MLALQILSYAIIFLCGLGLATYYLMGFVLAMVPEDQVKKALNESIQEIKNKYQPDTPEYYKALAKQMEAEKILWKWRDNFTKK